MKTFTCFVLALAIALLAQDQPSPKVKTGQIQEKQQYKSGTGLFTITVPEASNPFVRSFKFRASQVKHENYDYEEVVFQIADFGQAYGAGVRRIPRAALEQMAKEEPRQTLSKLATKALFQWRDDYGEEPQLVDEAPVETQFGAGLLRLYVAKHSSLLAKVSGTDQRGKPKAEKTDARILVLVVKKDDWFIYAAGEDEYMGTEGAALDPRKQITSFFASMTVKFPAGQE